MTKHKITVQKVEDNQFKVIVTDNSGATEYTVAVGEEYVKELGVIGSPADLVEHSFEFLLERESKEAILRKFNLRDISKYFPEYEQKIKNP